MAVSSSVSIRATSWSVMTRMASRFRFSTLAMSRTRSWIRCLLRLSNANASKILRWDRSMPGGAFSIPTSTAHSSIISSPTDVAGSESALAAPRHVVDKVRPLLTSYRDVTGSLVAGPLRIVLFEERGCLGCGFGRRDDGDG
ncbi:unnamed protein product [Parascedosporium putredinis]|uniref:Uncharacterized protein n=1 Tax=Parascedosporium putredinis TaxID=1442378 RepID=A0A9P1M9T5_9PEZI|nr:unnamed protein product [Parascedosporium putredinis]CAI7992651.1 unnamed protein product [Parascedosporium putredinis]